jgi:hypothetical protein
MLYGFLSLMTTTSIFVISGIGLITVINKAGNFLKTMEEEKKDSYKKAFDKFMIETIEELNNSIDSLKLISKHTLKNGKLLFDLASGNKCIKKDKDGNIILSDKSILTEEYKSKIEHLYTKLKKYQNEVKKYKNNDESSEKSKENGKKEDNKKEDNKKDDDKKENNKKENNKKENNKKQEINDDSDDTISDDDDDDNSDTDELEYYLEADK